MFTRHPDSLDPQIVTLAQGVVGAFACRAPSLDKNGVFELLPIFAAQMRRFCILNKLNYDLISTHYWLSGLVGMRLALNGMYPVTSFHTMAGMKRRGRPGESK
ncbi:MAG: hypothetical protein Ct9H300mP19_17890 [Dehalococcoidia bacterium]|nr:MAG: hypothetical protein Ct9H300mP19_17890 [Dehalococcoidia bacterium]